MFARLSGPARPAALTLAWLALAGCAGEIPGSRDQGRGPGDDTAGAAGGGGPRPGTMDPGGAGTGGAPPPAPVAAPQTHTASPGLRRLTRTEYVHTVRDLLGVELRRDDAPGERVVNGHGEIAAAQKIGYDDTNLFHELADTAATTAAAKLAAEIAACADAACLKTWAGDLLLRAFRAPPAPALLDRYAAMLASEAAGATPAERLTTFLTSVLTSPHFLYRKELGSPVAGDASVRNLDAYEVATRLSYLAWQSGPDRPLLAAAAKKTLVDPAGRATELARMLQDPRAQRGMRAFVADWMALFENHLARKDAAVLAGTAADLPQVAERAFDLLVDDVLAGGSARLTDLLKVEHLFADAALAKIVGATAAGAGLQKVSVNGGQRLGILTHPLVIGAHSKESGASPFPIGKFIYENVLCEEIAPPPATFPTIEDAKDGGKTLRQSLEELTQGEPCFSCHVKIGPPGFAFLPFDPVGRFNARDAAGRPFDTSGALVLPGAPAPVPFAGVSDLASTLAGRPEVQRCLARRLFRWAYGRFESDRDQAAVAALEKAAISSGAAVGELLRQVVAAPAFSQVRLR